MEEHIISRLHKPKIEVKNAENGHSIVVRVRNLPLRGVLTVIGAFLVHSTISTGYVFGNMNPYLTSYLRKRSQSSNVTYSDTIWISTANYITQAVFMPILGLIEQKVPPRICTLIGGLFFNAGMLLTFFTMKHSLGLTILTYGALNGAAKGMTYPEAIKSALKWFPHRSGLVTGIIICGIGFGTFVFNEITTEFINPENLSPDEEENDDLFFTQDALLDRVPFSFLLLGGIYTAVQLIAVLGLMSSAPEKPQKTENDGQTDEGENRENDGNKSNMAASGTHSDEPGHSKSDSTEDDDGNYTPRQVLKTKLFYLLWSIYVCVVLGIFFVMNFYKTFSQTFIRDDHFLTLAGSVSSVFNALGRPAWGAVGDKLGYRETLVIVITIFGTAGATFTLCEYGGKPMLMIWLCLLYGTFSGFYSLMPSLMVSIYGQKYYSVNFGLLFTHQIVVQLIGALLTSQLKSAIGWQGILYIGAGGIIFSLVLAIGLLVQYRLGKRKQLKNDQKSTSTTAATRL